VIYCASKHIVFTILPLLKKMVMFAIRGTIIFTKECINHYKIYQGHNDLDIFLLLQRNNLFVLESKKN
jgi:hypothetical protein